MVTPEYKTFLFEYFHDGARWCVEIPAVDMEDAQARINKLPLATPLGEMVAKLPAGAGLFVRCFCCLRNFFHD